jgi:hypothetical protein
MFKVLSAQPTTIFIVQLISVLKPVILDLFLINRNFNLISI